MNEKKSEVDSGERKRPDEKRSLPWTTVDG
jgi:hypothetical protein